VEIRVVLL